MGKRSPDWVKLKLVRTQEFVVGGWTEPRGTRSAFGALLLGVYENGALEYVGHTGSGFDETELRRVAALMKPLETPASPFRVRPRPNERPHWVRPELVAQVKFTEWTDDGKLRHPTYLGLRDDVEPSRCGGSRTCRRSDRPRRPAADGRQRRRSAPAELQASRRRSPPDTEPRRDGSGPKRAEQASSLQPSLDQLQDLERAAPTASLRLPGGEQLEVSNLHKVFWPRRELTKGDLMRYYVQVSPRSAAGGCRPRRSS